MAGVFAGFAKSLTAESSSKGNGGKAKSQHEVFISTQVLPLTIKLQKEMRGRRYTVRIHSVYLVVESQFLVVVATQSTVL